MIDNFDEYNSVIISTSTNTGLYKKIPAKKIVEFDKENDFFLESQSIYQKLLDVDEIDFIFFDFDLILNNNIVNYYEFNTFNNKLLEEIPSVLVIIIHSQVVIQQKIINGIMKLNTDYFIYIDENSSYEYLVKNVYNSLCVNLDNNIIFIIEAVS